LILFSLTSTYPSRPLQNTAMGIQEITWWANILPTTSATTNTAYDQVSLCSFHLWKDEIRPQLNCNCRSTARSFYLLVS
jgi:hypothetical protein